MEFPGGPDQIVGGGTAEHFIGFEHGVDTGRLDLAIVERRRRGCAVDLARAGKQRGAALRIGQRHRQRFELVGVARTERLFGGHLQHDGVDRHLHRGQRDAVLLGEILDRLDVGITGVDVDLRGGLRRDAAHLAIALGPQRDQRRDTAGGDFQTARQQRVVHDVAGGKGHPLHLDAGKTGRRAVLLDQLLMLHDHQRQVGQAGLFGQSEFGYFGRGRGCDKQSQHQRQQTSQGDSSNAHVSLPLCLWPGLVAILLLCPVFHPPPLPNFAGMRPDLTRAPAPSRCPARRRRTC